MFSSAREVILHTYVFLVFDKQKNFDTHSSKVIITMSLNAKIGKYCNRRKFNCTKLAYSENNQNSSSSTSPLKRKTSLFSANKASTSLKKIDTTCGKNFIEEDSGFCEDFSNNNSVGKCFLFQHIRPFTDPSSASKAWVLYSKFMQTRLLARSLRNWDYVWIHNERENCITRK